MFSSTASKKQSRNRVLPGCNVQGDNDSACNPFSQQHREAPNATREKHSAHSFDPPLTYQASAKRRTSASQVTKPSYLSPHSLNVLLHIAPKLLRLLQRRKMAAALVLLVRDEIRVLFQHVLDAREQLVGEEGEADGFLNICQCLAVQLAVGLERGEDARCEPVERDVGEDVG